MLQPRLRSARNDVWPRDPPIPSFASLPQGTRFSELEGLRVSRRRAGALLPEPALAEPPGTSRTSNPEPEIGQNQNTVFADDTNEESGDSVWWNAEALAEGPGRPAQPSFPNVLHLQPAVRLIEW